MPSALLVPLDGSELSKRALPYALALARAQHRRLVLARVLEPRAAPGTPLLQESTASQDLDDIAQRLGSEDVDVEMVVSSTLRGTVAQVILTMAHERSCEAIVMSTHGRSGPGRWVFGSVAEDVLRQSSLPVLMVPPRRERAWPTGRPLRVLVPLDGSELAEQVVAPLVALIKPMAAEAVLLRVLPPTTADAAAYMLEDRPAEMGDAQRALEGVAESLHEAGLKARTRVALGAPTATVINNVVREESIDLIAMATHGRSGLPRMVLGSVAAETVQQAAVPVMLLRPASLGGVFSPPAHHSAPEVTGPPTFLVALDVSSKAETALGPTATLARECVGRVILLNCFWPPVDTAHVVASTRAECVEYVQSERRMFLEHLARSLPGIDVTARVEVQKDGEEVDECVARVACEVHADVVVVVSGAAATPAGLVLGGFAQGIVRLSPCPVLVIKSRADQAGITVGNHASNPTRAG